MERGNTPRKIFVNQKHPKIQINDLLSSTTTLLKLLGFIVISQHDCYDNQRQRFYFKLISWTTLKSICCQVLSICVYSGVIISSYVFFINICFHQSICIKQLIIFSERTH